MRKEEGLFRVVLAVFVIAGLIFAATQVQDAFLAWVIGGLTLVFAVKEVFGFKRRLK